MRAPAELEQDVHAVLQVSPLEGLSVEQLARSAATTPEGARAAAERLLLMHPAWVRRRQRADGATMYHCCPTDPREAALTVLDAARRALERVFGCIHDAPAAERGQMLELTRGALLLLALADPRRADMTIEDIGHALDLALSQVELIRQAQLRGDLETWAFHHAGRMSADEMVLRLLATGRTRMAPDPGLAACTMPRCGNLETS